MCAWLICLYIFRAKKQAPSISQLMLGACFLQRQHSTLLLNMMKSLKKQTKNDITLATFIFYIQCTVSPNPKHIHLSMQLLILAHDYRFYTGTNVVLWVDSRPERLKSTTGYNTGSQIVSYRWRILQDLYIGQFGFIVHLPRTDTH